MPAASASTLARTLLTLLRRLEAGWQTLDQLAQAVGRHPRRVRYLLDDLRAAGAVIEADRMATPYRYRLVRRW